MAVCRYMVTCPKWPECRHGGFTARDTLLPGSHRASPGVFPSVHGVSGHTETGCIPHHGHGVLGTASAAHGSQARSKGLKSKMEFAKLWVLYRKHWFYKSSEVLRVPKGVTMIFGPQRRKKRRASVTKSLSVAPYASRMPFSNCQPVNIPTKISEYDDVARRAPAAIYSGDSAAILLLEWMKSMCFLSSDELVCCL